jgi:hypothetical protein
MTQIDLEMLVARATGESVAEIQCRGFGLADPPDVNYDPEPGRPRVLDWNSMTAVEWPG